MSNDDKFLNDFDIEKVNDYVEEIEDYIFKRKIIINSNCSQLEKLYVEFNKLINKINIFLESKKNNFKVNKEELFNTFFEEYALKICSGMTDNDSFILIKDIYDLFIIIDKIKNIKSNNEVLIEEISLVKIEEKDKNDEVSLRI